jgi:molybdopterin converting factor small subunit
VAKFYPPFELSEKLGKKMVEIDAPDLETFLKKGSELAGKDLRAESRRFAILVNGRNIRYLGGLKTPLGPDDEVFFVYGSGGG